MIDILKMVVGFLAGWFVVGLLVARPACHFFRVCRAQDRLPEQDGEGGGQMDGRVEQFHAGDNA